MPVNVIGTLKPKNNGKFPVAEAVDIKVSDNLRLDAALENKADLSSVNFALAGKANASDFTTSTANLQGQIDQIVISASAESVVAPEVAAARVGTDGTSYNTLKARLDAEQQSNIKAETEISDTLTTVSDIFKTSNLLSLKTRVYNAYYAAHEYTIDTYDYFKFIPIESGKTYKFAFTARYVAFFDSTKSYVSFSENLTTFTADSNGYVHVSVAHSVPESNLKMFENTEVQANVPEINQGFSSDVTVHNLTDDASIKIKTIASATKQGYYNPTTGVYVYYDENYLTSDPISILPGIPNNKVHIRSSLSGTIGIVVFDETMQPIFALNGNNATEYGYIETTAIQDVELTVSPQARYIVNAIRTPLYTSLDRDMSIEYAKPITILNENAVDSLNIVNGAVTAEKLANRAAVKNISSPGKNRININTSLLNAVLDGRGNTTVTYNGYDTSDFINISDFNEKICVSPKLRKFCQYDANKQSITTTYVDEVKENYVTDIDSNAKYVRITYWHEDAGRIQVEDSATPTTYEAYSEYLDDEINALNNRTKAAVEQLISGGATDALNGKKWCPFGDSFTDYTNKNYSSGQFNGKSMSYPRLISERTGIIIDQNFFLSGRTMAYPEDQTFENSATCPTCPGYYQNIPEDTDYITIMLGINDVNHMSGSGTTPDGEDATGIITLGTIDDETTSTYYGAYNTVLAWIRENRPFAHVGIIVTNGTQREDFTNAQIAVAKKWGYPYINLNGDERTPAFIRCYNPNMPAALKDQIKTIQAVEYPSNTHPNWQTHEVESTIIENFLRTL